MILTHITITVLRIVPKRYNLLLMPLHSCIQASANLTADAPMITGILLSFPRMVIRMHPVLKFVCVVAIALCLMAGCGCSDGRIENGTERVSK